MNVQPVARVAGGPPLRILWTLPYLPWPTTSGGKLRQFHLLRALSARPHHRAGAEQGRAWRR